MKNKHILPIFILLIYTTFALYSFLPTSIFDFQPINLILKSSSDIRLISIVLLAILIIFTLIYGRFFCTYLCPLGILFELITRFSHNKNPDFKYSKYIKYTILIFFLTSIIFGTKVFVLNGKLDISPIKYLDPFVIFSSALSLSIPAILILGTLIYLTYKNGKRVFCASICPVGTLLGLISKYSLKKITIDKDKCISCGICADNCHIGCIDVENETIDTESCVNCHKCIDECPNNAISHSNTNSLNNKFNKKRRDLLTSIVTISCIGGIIGVKSNKSKIQNIEHTNVILPPGAGNIDKFKNLCIDCNLCVQACPKNVIKKANFKTPNIHINYNKVNEYCEFGCTKCMDICPTGALQRIGKEIKQKTKIAKIKINRDKCLHCGNCASICPTGALERKEAVLYYYESKCIGCGACKSKCFYGAISFSPINNQKII